MQINLCSRHLAADAAELMVNGQLYRFVPVAGVQLAAGVPV